MESWVRVVAGRWGARQEARGPQLQAEVVPVGSW